MRRIETYVGQQVYEWAFSAQAQLTMTAIAKVCAALFGTSGTVNGLACTPTSPATMTVQIGAGEIYQMESLEATTCGTLPADTTHTILKQGIQLGTYTTSTFAAPGTSGQSINYLIEAQYQDSDISLDPTTGNTPVVLQFYNSTNPVTPWSGPNNSGSTSNTFRDGIVAYQIKAGVAATTGSQVTPSPDTGWIGLWVVTVPYGATSLTSSNIAQYTGSPILPTGMLQSILTSNLTYGIDNGSANVVQATFPIPVTALTDGMDVWVKIKNANTGATTFTPNPGDISASPVIGAAHAALQGGELVASGRANLVWRQDVTSWVLVECTGAAIQIAPATASQHAVQLGQVQARGVQGSGTTSITTTSAISSSVAGGTVEFNSSSAITPTLPSASSVAANSIVEFISINTGAVTLSRAGTDTITVNNTTVTSLAFGNGDTLRLQSNGSNGWVALSGTVLTQYAATPLGFWARISGSASNLFSVYTTTNSDNSNTAASTSWVRNAMTNIATSAGFAYTFGTNGYIAFPNWLGGFVMAWGTGASGTGGAATITLPITFPNSIFAVFATVYANVNSNYIVTSSITNSSTITTNVAIGGSTTGQSGVNFDYFVIGH